MVLLHHCPFCGEPSPTTFEGIASGAIAWHLCQACGHIWAVSKDNPDKPIKVTRPKE